MAIRKQIPRVHTATDDPAQGRFNSEMHSAVRDLQGHFLAGAQHLTAHVGTSETKVPHRFGEKPRGWFQAVPTTVLVYQTKAPDDKYLYLIGGSAIDVDLIVF